MRHNRARELRTQGLAIIQLAGLQKFMIAFMILALMSLPFVQPVQKKEEAKKEEVKSAGDMTVEARWPGCKKYTQTDKLPVCSERIDIDIDLIGKTPDDERPVMYSNRAGKTFNLIRDDLGTANDSTDENTETLVTRGLPAGEYIINLHYFENREPGESLIEIAVDVVIRTKDITGGMKEILKRNVVLHSKGDEATVVRFTIKEDGELDKESVNDFFEELRSWQPQTQ